MDGVIGSLPPPQFTPEEQEDFENYRRARREEREKFRDRKDKQVSDWCKCGFCAVMDTDRECFCCNESECISQIRTGEAINCITKSSDFIEWVTRKTCLNADRNDKVLKGKRAYNSNRSATWRHLAYSKFISWLRAETLFGEQGRFHRFVIPACVVHSIRTKYPSEDGIYKGFKASRGQLAKYPA